MPSHRTQPFKIIRLQFDHPEDVQRFTGQHRYSKYADKRLYRSPEDHQQCQRSLGWYYGQPWGDGRTLWVAHGGGGRCGWSRRGHGVRDVKGHHQSSWHKVQDMTTYIHQNLEWYSTSHKKNTIHHVFQKGIQTVSSKQLHLYSLIVYLLS